MTQSQVKGIGFKLEKDYTHDQFRTLRYKRGVLEVEFTFEGNELVDTSLTIEEVNAMPINTNELIKLNQILNKQY
jgi:hypothetical protein